MAIINGTLVQKKSNISIEINAEVLEQIKSYCAWANISDISHFLEEAACYVFAKDKEWKSTKKSMKRSIKKKESAG